MSTPSPPGSYDELYRHYGNPHDAGFAERYIVRTSFCGHSIDCHTVIRPLLNAVEQRLDVEGLRSLVKTVDGCYVVRSIRGASAPSLHSWGLAIDVNAAEFPLGSRERQNPHLVIAFTDWGFFPGEDFYGRKDPMHFQFTRPHTI